MLRRIPYIAVSLVLLLSTTGFTISKHYCGSQLVDLRINAKAHSCCQGPGPCKCCHDESEYLKLNVDYTGPIILANLQVTDLDIDLAFGFDDIFKSLENIYHLIINNWGSPPPPGIHIVLSLLQTYLN